MKWLRALGTALGVGALLVLAVGTSIALVELILLALLGGCGG